MKTTINITEMNKIYRALKKKNVSVIGLGITGFVVLNDLEKGCVRAYGNNSKGQCDVTGWTDVAFVFAGAAYTLGVKFDGTLCVVGDNSHGECSLAGMNAKAVFPGSWSQVIQTNEEYRFSNKYSNVSQRLNDLTASAEIVQISYTDNENSMYVLLGDGKVFSVNAGVQNVDNWTNIVQIACYNQLFGRNVLFGLKEDGTVLTAGEVDDREKSILSWSNIIDVAATGELVLGLRSDGTVVSAGDNAEIVEALFKWTDILQIVCNNEIVAGLRSDGTVLVAGQTEGYDVSQWKNVIGVEISLRNLAGVCSDGVVYVCGDNEYHQCAANGEKVFNDFDNFVNAREIYIQKIAEQAEQRRAVAEAAMAAQKEKNEKMIMNRRIKEGRCKHCGSALKGFLFKKCSKCGKPKDY